MSQSQRDHVKSYLPRLELHLSQNIGAYESHKLASEYAKWAHPLGEEEQPVDKWLDETYAVRKQKPPGEAPSLFDGVPAAK